MCYFIEDAVYDPLQRQRKDAEVIPPPPLDPEMKGWLFKVCLILLYRQNAVMAHHLPLKSSPSSEI